MFSGKQTKATFKSYLPPLQVSETDTSMLTTSS